MTGKIPITNMGALPYQKCTNSMLSAMHRNLTLYVAQTTNRNCTL